MTVEFTVPRPTQGLVRERKPKFTPAKIPAPHHQLKNYLSTRCGEYIYYAANCEVYALHALSNRRHLVKALGWKPYCLDAAHGWIGVGGKDKGQCAFLQIHKYVSDPALPPYQHAEVDDLLPLNLDPDNRAILDQPPSTTRSTPRPPNYEFHPQQIGEDIVNSVVIHRLVGGREGLVDETVAILT